MIPIYSFLFPLFAAGQWRFARGLGKWKRWQFYLLMFGMALLTTFDIIFSLGFLLFVIGIAMPPHNALFSALHGQQPTRPDSWLFQWMQDIALKIEPHINIDIVGGAVNWRTFGLIYGAVRATCCLPGIMFLCGYIGSWVPLAGLIFFGEGFVYRYAPAIARLYNLDPEDNVTVAEIIMGYMVMSYGLYCALVLAGVR